MRFKKTLCAEADWLGSAPIFYDLGRGLVSSNIRDLMPSVETFKFHPEGLYNFFDFGYSVFGQTPIEGIRFLRHSSRIWREESGAISVEYLHDSIDGYTDFKISESDVIELIRERVQAWEASLPQDQQIVLPLSGGFDSRLLLWCLRDPSRVRAFTYGVSENQSRSMEVVYAKALAKQFGIKWEHIPLGDYHRYFDEWNEEFGVSTHAHGMYHLEFYTKIRERCKGRHALLSGIIGDAWAGSILPYQFDQPHQMVKLGYTHGMRADPARLRLATRHDLRDQFWSEQRESLAHYRFQVVTSMRFKLMLLSYLIRLPRLFDFEPWSPYLDIDIAMAMLNLPQERRDNRRWQRDFFAKVGLDLENKGLKSSRSNNLNLQALHKYPLKPLSLDLLSEVVDPTYLEWINRNVRPGFIANALNSMGQIPKIGGALRRLQLSPATLNAYFAYLTLTPIQEALKNK